MDLLADATCPRLVHSLNLCEVFYDSVRRVGEVAALAEIDDLLALGLVECPDMSREAWTTAGRVKAFHKRVSLADCFAIALASSRGAALVTTERAELEPFGEAGIFRICFLR